MDKLKPVMDNLKKYGFWILIGLMAVMILCCWWLATNSLAKEVKEKKGKIEEEFTTVQKIASDTQHPNQKYLDSLSDEQKKLNDKVFAAWKTLYDEQQRNNPWPTVLGKEFLDMINDPAHNRTMKSPTPSAEDTGISSRTTSPR